MTQYLNFLGEPLTERICRMCGCETNEEICPQCLEDDEVEVATNPDYRTPSERYAEAHADDED